MTWLRPRQGGFTSGGGGSSAGIGVPFIARVATVANVAALVGGAPSVVNGVALVVDDVVLVKNQAFPAQNGLYKVDVVGGGANGTWTRIQALNTGAELLTFFAVYVREGLVDPDVMYTLTTDPPYVIGVTPLAFTIYPSGVVASSAVLGWGAGSVNPTTTTRFLFPWYADDLAQVTAIRWRAPRAGTLRNLRVRHNVTAGNGNLIVYTARVNGVATLLLVSLASTTADGSNLVNTVAVAAGDLLDISVTKALVVGASPTDITAALEFV